MDGAPLAESSDESDVPAAVVCAVCGKADCAGCSVERKPRSAGGTPWELGNEPPLRRLWRTAVMTTVDGEAFFGDLDDGSVVAAFGFAISCELCAIASLAAVWVPLSYAFVPGLIESIFFVGEHRGLAAAGVVASVPLLAMLMVLLHVLWGTSLELGLRVSGAEPRAAHCLRYALYSCGWDLVTSPFGFMAGCVSSGVRGATRELQAAIRIPRFATRAYVGRARRLSDAKARRALGLAAGLTGAVIVAASVGLGVALVAAMVEF
jgi:hypothetical protein